MPLRAVLISYVSMAARIRESLARSIVDVWKVVISQSLERMRVVIESITPMSMHDNKSYLE